jgi:anti-sigma factor RsiW
LSAFNSKEVHVRCSSCEPLLDRYIEGTLTARQMADVAAHLRACRSCRALLEELKAVDGLLFTTRVPELPQNFTFAVMAEVNSMPAPRARQHPVWSFLALYSAAAWVAVVVGMALTHTSPAVLIGFIASVLAHAGVVTSAAAAGISRGLAHTVPTLAAFSVGVLVLDIAIAAAFAVLYFVVRPRLAAQLASSREAVS